MSSERDKDDEATGGINPREALPQGAELKRSAQIYAFSSILESASGDVYHSDKGDGLGLPSQGEGASSCTGRSAF